MTIQPWDSLCQALGTFASTALDATGNGEGFSSVEHVAEGEMILGLVNPIDTVPPDPSMLILTSPSAPNNTVETTVVDETHIRVRLHNPATGALRAGAFSIFVFNRPLPAVPVAS